MKKALILLLFGALALLRQGGGLLGGAPTALASAEAPTNPSAVPAHVPTAVYVGGKIYTVNEAQPWAEAVALRDGTIIAVGSDEEIRKLAGEGTQVVDLGGKLVLPGFVESHIHLALGGATLSGVILEMTDSIEDVTRKVKQYAEENPDKKTIFGAQYNALLFDEKGPNKKLLDEVVPDRPVFLMDHTLHSVWVNSKALEVARITNETPDPAGGQYVRGETGEATGAIKGGPAHAPVAIATGAITAEAMAARLPEIAAGLNRFGFTSAADMGAPIATEQAYEALHGLSKSGDLPLRLSMAYYVNAPKLADGAVEKLDGYAKRFRTDTLWFDTLKISGDSVIENQKAAMLEPYLTTKDHGSLYFTREELAKMAIDAAKKGYSTTVHTIGDAASRAALQAAGDVRAAGFDEVRFSTQHSHFVDPKDLPMYVEYDVGAQTTGNWAVFQEEYVRHLGLERTEAMQFPLRWWEDHGVTVALGADWPATPGGFENGVNPFNNIYVAMHRSAPDGLEEVLNTPKGKVLEPAQQTLTLEEAVRAYTMGGATLLGIEDEVGSIEVGKKADLIVLDRNLFEIDAAEIPKTNVATTVFDGRVVYDRSAAK